MKRVDLFPCRLKVGCEPAVSAYQHAKDFLITIAELTQGQVSANDRALGFCAILMIRGLGFCDILIIDHQAFAAS
jgi:hypothetical protein